MRRLLLLVFLSLITYLLPSQVIVRNEGIVVNNTVTGTWEGINIPRSVKTTLFFINSSVTSVNSAGFLLQAGDEGPLPANNNLDGAVLTGNRLTWNGTDAASITHGMFMGYNINYTVKYNYLDNTPYGILFKSGTDAGINMTYSSGYGASYNIVKNARMSLRMKGINGVQVYNNSFYSNQKSGSVIFIDANHDRTIPVPSTGAKIKNNIFYTVYQIPCISIESGCLTNFESDYNLFYCESGSPVFAVDGGSKTFSQWQAMGYDLHSVVINPNFNDITGFVPAARLDYGTDLGTTWQTGLSTSSAWIAGTAPATTEQNGKWQVGAIIFPAPVVVTPPPVTAPPVVTPPPEVTPPPVVIVPPEVNTPPVVIIPPEVNTPPVVIINTPSEHLSGFVGELDATGSYDPNNDNLIFTWTTPSNVSVSSANSSKIRFLSPVVSSAQTIEFILNVSDGKTVQTKTVPIKIIPYKPDLEFAEVVNIDASSFQPPYYPYNIIDGNIGTMWSANGDEQWLIMKLKELFSIQLIKIAFQPGQKTESYFDVFGSEDGETWEPILTKSASCGFSGDLQVFDFPASKSLVEFRFIKLVGHANSADGWNHISEFKVFGFRHKNPVSFEEQPVKLYPNPAYKSVNIRIDDPALSPDFIRIVNLTGKVVFEEKMDPGIKDLQIPINFKQGIYIVQLGSGDLTMFTQKLVVNI